jgi:hypothetical protein
MLFIWCWQPSAPGAGDGVAPSVKSTFFTVPARGASESDFSRQARALLAAGPGCFFADIRVMVAPCLRHRLILNLEADAEGIARRRSQELIEQIQML